MSIYQDIMSDPVYSPDRAAGDDEDVDQGHLGHDTSRCAAVHPLILLKTCNFTSTSNASRSSASTLARVFRSMFQK